VKILYVWDGHRDLPPERLESIEATRALYPDADFFCITKLKAFMSFTVVPWFDLMEEMIRFLGFSSMPWRWNEWMCFSDWARFYWLGMNPNTLYLDTDARMLKRYEFGDVPVYSPRNICLLYPGNCGARFLDLLKTRPRVNLLLNLFIPLSAWAQPMPEGHFRHAKDRK
jgi:hypothetical protein